MTTIDNDAQASRIKSILSAQIECSIGQILAAIEAIQAVEATQFRAELEEDEWRHYLDQFTVISPDPNEI